MPAAARRQRGIALLMVLVIVAIATVLTMGMIGRQHDILRRASSLFSQDQARLYALGAEDFVEEVIRQDTRDDAKSSTPTDTLGETWAQPFPPFPVPGGMVRVQISDAQALFNLNDLTQGGGINQPAVDYFQRLLRELGVADNLVYALVDWEDSDNQPVNADGAEDDYYSRMTPPYRAANRPLASMSELRLVRGFTPDVIRLLAPHVCVLPVNTAMNINTMDDTLMAALVDGLSPMAGKEMTGNRPATGYKSVDDFLSEAEFNGLSGPQKSALQGLLGVHTNFFAMMADADIDGHHTVLASVLQRGNSDTINVVSRDYGQKFQARKTSAAPLSLSGVDTTSTGTQP